MRSGDTSARSKSGSRRRTAQRKASCYTFVPMDATRKAIIYGKRTADNTVEFAADLQVEDAMASWITAVSAFSAAARLQKGREVEALAQLGDGEVNPACSRVPGALAIAVSMIEPGSGLRTPAGAPVQVPPPPASSSARPQRPASCARSASARFSISSRRAAGHRHLRGQVQLATVPNRRPAVTALGVRCAR